MSYLNVPRTRRFIPNGPIQVPATPILAPNGRRAAIPSPNGMAGYFHPGLGLYVPADVNGLLNDASVYDDAPTDTSASTSVTSASTSTSVTDTSASSVISIPSPDYQSALTALANDAQQFFSTIAGASQATPNSPVYDEEPPWITPPLGSQRFDLPGQITTPAANGTFNTVLTLTVPDGWDGLITRFANLYTGPGFSLQSLGSLTWQLLQNGMAVKNYDSIQFAFGTYTDGAGVLPYDLGQPGIPIYAGDIIQWTVANATTSSLPTTGTYIVCFLGGYLYPTPQ